MKNNNFRHVDNTILDKPMEIVYFVFPGCNGNCDHCWSSNMILGKVVSYEQHKKNIDKLSMLKIKELKLSGGEPFFNKNLGDIVNYIKKKLPTTKITIFTSGRPFVSTKFDESGVVETYKSLKTRIFNFNGISIQMSADEYHAEALKRLSTSNLSKEELLKSHVQNFIGACKKIKEEYPKFDYKLKIHVDFDRLKYHKDVLYPWLDDVFWNENVIKSEGLIRSGNAEQFKNSIVLTPSEQWSLFVLPGVDFISRTQKKTIDIFNIENKKLKMVSKKDEAIVIAGWWNLIDKKAYYFKLSDLEQAKHY